MVFLNDTNLTQFIDQECTVRLRYLRFPLDYGYYLCGPVLAVTIFVGLFGNVACLFTFFKSRPIPPVNYYTIPLCISDCAVLLGSFVMTCLPHLLYGRMNTYGPYVRLYPFANFFSNFAYTSCVWLVVLLSIERYFALCHPLRHKIYDAKRRSISISISCFLIALVYNLPRYFEIKVFPCFELERREYVYLAMEAPFRRSKTYWIVYKVIMGPLLYSFGPFLLLCGLSVRIYRTVKQNQPLRTQLRLLKLSKRGNGSTRLYAPIDYPSRNYSTRYSGTSSSGTSYEKQVWVLTHTLLSVVIKFLICHTLPTVIDLCETSMNPEQFYQFPMEHIVDTSTFLVALNSGSDFFIYAWCSGRFRMKLRAALRRTSSNSTGVARSLNGFLRNGSNAGATAV